MELCTNQTLLNRLNHLNEQEIKNIALRLISGLMDYEKEKIFTQLSLDTVVFGNNDEVKILDESLINLHCPQDMTKSNREMYTWLGMAPELTEYSPSDRRVHFTSASTVFSFGTILLQMFKGGEEFDFYLTRNKTEQAKNHASHNVHPIPEHCPNIWKDIIVRCLHDKPEARPTLAEVQNMIIQVEIGLIEQNNTSVPKNSYNALIAWSLFHVGKERQNEPIVHANQIMP